MPGKGYSAETFSINDGRKSIDLYIRGLNLHRGIRSFGYKCVFSWICNSNTDKKTYIELSHIYNICFIPFIDIYLNDFLSKTQFKWT